MRNAWTVFFFGDDRELRDVTKFLCAQTQADLDYWPWPGVPLLNPVRRG